MSGIGVFFSILFVEFPTYDWNQHTFYWCIKPEWIKLKKYADFGQISKISVQLDYEYYENGENAKIRKIYDNFP